MDIKTEITKRNNRRTQPKTFWLRMEKGQPVSFSVVGKIENYNNLFFEKFEESESYGEIFQHAIFQKNLEDMGNTKIGYVFTIDRIKLDESFIREKRKEKKIKKKSEIIEDESKHVLQEQNAKIIRRLEKDKEKHGFDITFQDERYYCPCGNSYSKRYNAVLHHKEHINK